MRCFSPTVVRRRACRGATGEEAGIAAKKAARKTIARAKAATAPRKTKRDLVLTLLMRKGGASLEEMQASTGWQAHSVRSFLSGTVGKRLGLKLISTSDASGTRRYAIKR